MRCTLTLLIAVLVSLFSGVSFAQDVTDDPETGYSRGIEVDVTVGARRVLIPMAIPDTQEPSGSTKGVAKVVQDTLRRDMDLAGFFKVLPNDSFFFDPSKEGMGVSEINFQNWFSVGAQGLIKSSVREKDGKMSLDLRLYVVDKGEQVTLKWKSKDVARDDIDDQVHEFVNAVIEFYTGEPGIFGTKIAFVGRAKGGNKQIWVMKMDGSGMGRVTSNKAINILPSFGGGAVYFTSYKDENPDLWVWRGGEAKKISSRSGQNSGAAYCGGKLAVTLSMGGENADVYLIDPSSGKMVKRLTDHWAIDTSPTWSSDCSQIAFVSSRSGGPQIYVMAADGSGQRRLTYQGTYNTSPSWSPKENKIAFTARDERNRFDIFTVDLEGNIERLTQDQGNNQDPTFSPDGRYIAFSSDRGGKGDRIWMMTNDGEIQKLITSSGSGFTSPSWER